MQERRVACRAQVALLIQILEVTIPMNAIVFHSPVGDIYLYEENHCLAAVSHTLLKTDACWQETPLLREAARQLDEYFRGSRRQFTLPLQTHGTPFQCAVWQMLQQIPYGRDPFVPGGGRRNGQPPESVSDHRALSPGNRQWGQSDGICRRTGHEALSAAA